MSAEPLSFAVTRRLGLWLEHWGVDPEQYHWLLQASLRMDFRARSSLRTGHQSSETRSALIITGATYLIFSVILGISLRVAGVGTFLFAAVMFAYAMTMMAMSILMEFGMVVISPDDFLILAHRPVSSRTFFAVKCSNLLFYTLLLDLSLSLAPAVIGWTFKEAPWHFPIMYLASATLAGIFVVALVAALYGFLLQRINYERFKDLLAWCQILFSFIFFFGYQLIPRLLGRIHGFRVEDAPSIIAVLPPFWFASLNELGLGHFSLLTAVLGVLAVTTIGLLLPVLLRSVSLDYSDRIGGMVAAAVTRRTGGTQLKLFSSTTGLERFFAFDQEERALFGFLFKMLRRNRLLKLQLYPNFGIVLALFAVAVMEHEHFGDPLAGETIGVAAIFPLMAFLFAAMGFTASLPYSDEYQGAWIFHIAPIRRPERFLRAIKKALLLVLFLPLFLLNIILFSCFWPIAHAAAMSLYGLAIGLATFEATLFWFQVFPFSRKPSKGAQSRRLGMFLVVMVAYSIFMALPGLLASQPSWLALVLLLLFAVTGLLGRLNCRAYARAIRQLEFEAE